MTADSDLANAEQVCSLPGCSNPIDPVLSGEARRYCGPAHRKIARKLRRDKRAAQDSESGAEWAARSNISIRQANGSVTTTVAQGSDTHRRNAGAAEPTTGRRKAVRRVPQRRLIAEPRSRWFRRSSRPFAARGFRHSRPVRTLAPLPSQPSWLWPKHPRRWVDPDPHALRSEPPPASSPVERTQPIPSVSPAGPIQPPASPVARPLGPSLAPDPAPATAARGRLAQLRGKINQRRAEGALARQDAAAVLSGAPLPGEVVDAPKRRRRKRRRPAPVPFQSVEQPAWTSQMREALAAALHSLANNRLRSLLTTVGIVVGVASVIVLVAMGNGMKENFNAEFSKLANQISIKPAKGSVPTGRVPRNLTDRDVEALSDPQRAPSVAAISPAMVGNVQMTADQAQNKATLVGASGNYLELLNRNLVAGTWFTKQQLDSGARATVIGTEALNLLWGRDTAPEAVIGEPVRLGTSTFKVQGVVASDGQNDNTAIVPFRSARSHLVGSHEGKVDLIILKSTSVETVSDAASEAVQILDEQHSIRAPADRDFNVQTFTELLKQSTQYINFLTIFIVAVAAISLFVGGVGVANIMLVAVTERTREIGIRKAIGAKTTAILRQFLCEAVMLTGLGGLIGVVLGVGCALVGAAVLPGVDSEIPVPILTMSPVLIAFVVSLAIGVVAGGYPANRAARLRPIEALRFE